MTLSLEIMLLGINYLQVFWLLGYKKYFTFRQAIFLTGYILFQMIIYYVFKIPNAINLLIPFAVIEFIFLIRFLQSWILAALYFLLQNTMMLLAWLVTWDSLFIIWVRRGLSTAQLNQIKPAILILQQIVLLLLILLVKKVSEKYSIFESVSQLQKKYIFQSLLCIVVLYALNMVRIISLAQLQILKFIYLTVLLLVFTGVFCYMVYLISRFYLQKQNIQLLSKKTFQEEHKLDLANEFRHDYRNILLSLLTYLENNQVEQAHQYVSSIVEYSNSFIGTDYITQVSAVKSPPIQGLLINFLETCHEKKIPAHFVAKQEISDFDVTINLLDFIRCFSILLDNAVEASLEMEKPLIEVTIEMKEQSMHVEVRNAFEGKISFERLLKNNFTTKEGHQGKGLHIYVKLLKQYRKTRYSFTQENEFFIARFSLPKNE